jgi:C4-dicarboxylate transporter DctM subunit
VIIGGIYSGVFSPTEAAGVASVYAIIVSYFIYREVTLADIFETAARSMYLTGLIFLIVAPLLAPVAASLGVDPIHFGVIVVMNLTIGTFHPPFGLNIFVIQALFKTPSETLYKGLIPFVILAVIALQIVTYVPAISLTVEHLLFR